MGERGDRPGSQAWTSEDDAAVAARARADPAAFAAQTDVEIAQITNLGWGYVPADLSDADLAATNAQLQHWILDPGANVALEDQAGAVNGVVVDIVLEGVAVVTVDAPAIVYRGRFTQMANVEYPRAGEPVELVRGDSISYPAGRAKEVTNPLTTVPLQLKSAVLYGGDVARTRPTDGAGDGRQIRVDGDGVLPGPIGTGTPAERQVLWGQVVLEYVRATGGTELDAQAIDLEGVVIGPVDSLNGPGEGFVLRVAPLRG